MIRKPRTGVYPDREVDCQEATEPGFQAIIDCMIEAGWTRGGQARAAPADRCRQHDAEGKRQGRSRAAIPRAMIRAGWPDLRSEDR